jgi:hypothetical protein
MQLGYQTSRGGLAIDDVVGVSISSVGLAGIAKNMNSLDREALDIVCAAIERSGREPIEAVIDRDRTFERTAFGWRGRLNLWLENRGRQVSPASHAAINARLRETARQRLVLAEAAVRRFQLDHEAPPDSLAALVPKYLARLPRDPYGDGPLVYRRTAEGYLLYSVGKNRRDDGGQRTTLAKATENGEGDLFFDAD